MGSRTMSEKPTADLAVVDVPIEALRPHPRNPRTITPARLAQLQRTLESEREMLRARPIVALPDGTVIAGNQRLAAAAELGWDTLPVVYADLDEERALRWMLLDNRSFGADDASLAADLLAELADAGSDLALTGYDSGDVDRMLREFRLRDRDPDDAPPLPAGEPRSRRGEVYELGPHRMMCGDATSPEDVASLLDGSEPELCLTDPPYGVNYEPAWRQRAAEEGHLAYAASRVGEVANDDRADWEPAWRLLPGDVVYAWSPPGSTRATHQHALERAGFDVRMEVIWVKPHLPISRGHYHVRHEPCFYAVRRGGKSHWIGDRKQTTIWEISLDRNVAGGHSTQKPVECFLRPIRNHDGDIYDPFSGTGSSLIAAEIEGRRCFAMESDPAYCDVIRDRYEAFVGG